MPRSIGYVTSICEAFKKQKEEKEEGWGLVMTMATEVKEACKDLINENYKSAAMNTIDPHAYERGFKDGKDFDPCTKLDVSKN